MLLYIFVCHLLATNWLVWLTGSSKLSCKPFLVDGVQLGYISPQISSFISSYSDVFVMVKGNNGEITHVTLTQELKTFTERTQKIAEVMEDLRLKDVFSTLKGWRNEASWNLCLIELSYHYIYVHDAHVFVIILSFCQINVMKTNTYNSCGVITTLDMLTINK